MEAFAVALLFDMNYLKRIRKIQRGEIFFRVHAIKARTTPRERRVNRSRFVEHWFDR